MLLRTTALLSEPVSAIVAIVGGLLVFSIAYSFYQLFLSPLSKLPGPLVAKCSPFYVWYICYRGIEGHVMRDLHLRYKTTVLRIAPNSISISDPAAIQDIYITSGGLPKDSRYENFDLGPIKTIFSALDPQYRDTRAKAVAPLFSTGKLRNGSSKDGAITHCVEEWVEHLRAFKESGLKMDLLDVCARISVDSITSYLFGERYGGLSEHAVLNDMQARQKHKLSANHFIFSIVAIARFSLFPNWLFKQAFAVYSKLSSSDDVTQSFIKLDEYSSKVMDKMSNSKEALRDTYQGRLVQAGVRPEEAAAQVQAVVFAGTDSTSVTMTTIFFHLIQNPEFRTHILAEVRDADESADPRTLPHLRAAVKEGLRLGMANPTRLTRLVTENGFHVGGYFIPPGTQVGCAAYVLHDHPEVFPDPFNFRPERWLEDGHDGGLRRPEMDRSILAFGAGTRGCIGKNLAQEQLYQAVRAVIESEVLDGAKTVQPRIEMVEWFNGEIKGHHLDVEWSS